MRNSESWPGIFF